MFRDPFLPRASTLGLPLLAALALCPAPAAQTGPFQDGELLVHKQLFGQPEAFLRVVPETGASAALISGFVAANTPGGFVFDSFRNAVVASISQPPDFPLNYKPWVIAHDGTSVALPGISFQGLRALCSKGDGKLYFQRSTGSTTIEYYDAGNQLHTLLDAAGQAPFQLSVQHMLYDAPGNALIATVTWSSFGIGCVAGMNTVYRIPLSADGTRVGGGVTCAPYLSGLQEINGLDALPDGRMLITLSSGVANVNGRLAVVDPATLSVTPWASPAPTNLRGGVYSARLGKAVVFDTFFAVLRRYGAGDTGDGVLLTVSQAFDDGIAGANSTQRIVEIDALGPACNGFHTTYGSGKAGTGGFVPKLSATGCPDLGEPWSIVISDAVGGAGGLLFVGFAPASLPFIGGQFLVGSVVLEVPIVVGGLAGSAGTGSLAIPVLLNDPLLLGFDLYLQAGFFDAGASFGASLANGLHFQPG